MKLSPLVIEGYYVKELSIAVTPKYENEPEYFAEVGFHFQPAATYSPDPVTFDVLGDIAQHPDEPNRWRYDIQIKSHGRRKKKFPYSFDITLVGFFRIAEGLTDNNFGNLLLYANAPAVLYSAAREILAAVTGRGPYPAIMLPSVTFVDNTEKMAAEMAKRIKPIEEKKVAGKKVAKKGTRKRESKKAMT
jgi:preprotein translocase subunit SecB